MNNFLYTLTIILLIAWAIGFLGLQLGGLVHILLVIAIFALIIRVFHRKKPI